MQVTELHMNKNLQNFLSLRVNRHEFFSIYKLVTADKILATFPIDDESRRQLLITNLFMEVLNLVVQLWIQWFLHKIISAKHSCWHKTLIKFTIPSCRKDNCGMDKAEWVCRWKFFRQKPPWYNGMEKNLPAEGWLLCMEEICYDCNIPDNGLWIRLAVLTFTDQRWGGGE